MHYIVYHADCIDGKSAAAVCLKRLQQDMVSPEAITLLPGRYGDVNLFRGIIQNADDHFWFVDFSLPREDLEDLCGKVNEGNLIVLDHHKTAQEALEGLPFCTFDMNKCGTRLAYDRFFLSDDSRPLPDNFKLIDYVGDWDLWKKALPHTNEIHAFLGSHLDGDWDTWVRFIEDFEDNDFFRNAISQGGAILREHEVMITRALAGAQPAVVAGHSVRMACCDKSLCSQVCYELLEVGNDFFSASFFLTSPGWCEVSLRSRKDPDGSFDVSKAAQQYGGGGHLNAAGFKCSLRQLYDMMEFQG